MLDREQIIEIAASLSAVGLMLAAMVAVGSTYGTGSTLSPEGGWMLVWVIVGFILLLAVVGIGLAYLLNDSEGALDANDDSDANGTF